MNRTLTLRLAAVAGLVAALLLTGCGRKGPLDLPPSASAVPQAQSEQQPKTTATQPLADTGSKPVAAPGQKRALPMDVLLN